MVRWQRGFERSKAIVGNEADRKEETDVMSNKII